KSRIKELLLSRGAMFAYVFILPYVLFFTVFRIGPALYGMVLSFGRYSLAGRLRFSGVDNYVRLFQDDVFWNSLRVTAIYSDRKSRIKELLLSRGAMFAYVFILPYVLFFTVFRIGPALYGMVLSFGRYSLAGRLRFSGVDNYVRLFQDDVFWNSLRVTAIYALDRKSV